MQEAEHDIPVVAYSFVTRYSYLLDLSPCFEHQVSIHLSQSAPLDPPPPNAPSDFTTLRIAGTSISPWAQTMCRKKLFVQVYIFWVPTLLLLSPLCTLLQLSAGPPSSPFLPLFSLSFPVAFILARTGSQAEPFLDHIRSFRDCLIATSTLRILL